MLSQLPMVGGGREKLIYKPLLNQETKATMIEWCQYNFDQSKLSLTSNLDILDDVG